jgi:hypothetical protein
MLFMLGLILSLGWQRFNEAALLNGVGFTLRKKLVFERGRVGEIDSSGVRFWISKETLSA